MSQAPGLEPYEVPALCQSCGLEALRSLADYLATVPKEMNEGDLGIMQWQLGQHNHV